jgi:hypothetical protein
MTIVPMPDELLTAEQIHAAKAALVATIGQLKLSDDLGVRFYLPPDHPKAAAWQPVELQTSGIDAPTGFKLAGFRAPSYSKDVWVRFDLSPSEMAKTVCHELRHAWQSRWPWKEIRDDMDVGPDPESDAEAFAVAMVAGTRGGMRIIP